MGPWFATGEDLAASNQIPGKVLIYLWDDLLRHHGREQVFNLSVVRTVGELSHRVTANEYIFNDELLAALNADFDVNGLPGKSKLSFMERLKLGIQRLMKRDKRPSTSITSSRLKEINEAIRVAPKYGAGVAMSGTYDNATAVKYTNQLTKIIQDQQSAIEALQRRANILDELPVFPQQTGELIRCPMRCNLLQKPDATRLQRFDLRRKCGERLVMQTTRQPHQAQEQLYLARDALHLITPDLLRVTPARNRPRLRK